MSSLPAPSSPDNVVLRHVNHPYTHPFIGYHGYYGPHPYPNWGHPTPISQLHHVTPSESHQPVVDSSSQLYPGWGAPHKLVHHVRPEEKVAPQVNPLPYFGEVNAQNAQLRHIPVNAIHTSYQPVPSSSTYPGWGQFALYNYQHLHHANPQVDRQITPEASSQTYPSWGAPHPLIHHVNPSVNYNPIIDGSATWPGWGWAPVIYPTLNHPGAPTEIKQPIGSHFGYYFGY